MAQSNDTTMNQISITRTRTHEVRSLGMTESRAQAEKAGACWSCCAPVKSTTRCWACGESIR